MSRTLFLASGLCACLVLGAATTPGRLAAQPSASHDAAPVYTTSLAPANVPAANVPAAGDVAAEHAAIPADGPWATPAAFPVATQQQAAHVDLRQQRKGGIGAGTNLALIGVGAAAIIGGAVAGDTAGTILIAGGTLLALYGLFRLLQ